jgi:hypothetical protein
LRTSNEVSIAFGEEKEVALAEIGALRGLLGASALRASNFMASARRTLSWIAEKGAGTTIAELSKMALKHVIEWLS